MMDAVAIPPFETFYAEHSREVLGLLRRKLGRDRADDAFQETFLRALRAYDRLEHGEHLRAWVLTIASRVAIDVHRRTTPTAEVPELPHEDARPAYEDLGELTDGLPPKERAAVVLRYGYDLTYDQIAAALDSSPDAARQAASTGVRRLRKEKTRMSVPTDLDRRFREAAARSGMLDAGYDLVDTPGRRSCSSPRPTAGCCGSRSTRIPEQQLERLARLAGRACCGRAAAVDSVRRELDEYFEGRRHAFDLAVDLRGLTPFSERVLARARAGAVRRDGDVRRARRRAPASRRPPARSARS